MKKLLLVLGMSFLLFSCDSKSVDVVKKDLTSKSSIVEVSGTIFNESELSDKQTYLFIVDYYTNQFHKYGVSQSLDLASDALKEVSKTKGNVVFHKIEYYKMSGSDTINKGLYYTNDKDSIIFQHHIK